MKDSERVQPANTMSARLRSAGAVLICFSPVMALFTALLIYGIIGMSLVFCSDLPTVSCTDLLTLRPVLQSLIDGQIGLSDYTAVLSASERFNWIISVAVCVVFALVTCAVTCYLMFQASSYGIHRARWISVPPMFAAAIGVLAFYTLSNLDRGDNPWQIFIHGGIEQDFSVIEPWSLALDSIGLVVAVYAALGICLMLLPSVKHRARWEPDLLRHMRHLQVLLYVSSVFLVAMVIRTSAFFQYSLSYLPIEGVERSSENVVLIDAFQELANAIVLSRGLLYTLILAAVYVPAALMLHHRVKRLEKSNQLPDGEKQEGLQNFSLSKSSMGIAAVLMPLVSGPAVDILGGLLG